MTLECDRGLFLYVDKVPGSSSGWAVLPRLALIDRQFKEQVSEARLKSLQAHERNHWRQQEVVMGLSFVGLAVAGELLAWPLWGLVALLGGLASYYVVYALSACLRMAWEVRAEAVERAYLYRAGEWEPSRDELTRLANSHIDAYYGRIYLRGQAPSTSEARIELARAIEREGVPVMAGDVG